RLATFTDLDELLRYATGRTRELLDAEGAAVMLLDPARQEFNFGVASQSETHQATSARLLKIRFPAHLGVAGWVLAHDEAAAVPDAQQDPRFYNGVDQVTNITTHAILCAPLRARSGNIGVIEVINPARPPAADDLEFLETLASDIAVAHEKAALQERLRGERRQPLVEQRPLPPGAARVAGRRELVAIEAGADVARGRVGEGVGGEEAERPPVVVEELPHQVERPGVVLRSRHGGEPELPV